MRVKIIVVVEVDIVVDRLVDNKIVRKKREVEVVVNIDILIVVNLVDKKDSIIKR